MQQIQFDGQQEGERILAEITPNIIPVIIKLLISLILIIFFEAVLFSISGIMTMIGPVIRMVGLITGVIAMGFFGWSVYAMQAKTRTYITDRRIIRFEMLSPVFTAKRSLFWSEVLKAKGYSTNLFLRLVNVGSVQIEPQAAEHETIRITNVSYFDDIANYIDKILYTYKNKPDSLNAIKPFIFAARGKRGSA
jgi:hypothetical protein